MGESETWVKDMQTALFETHRALGGKIVNFFGWQMPLQYKGVIKEHQAVRSSVGIFDVSHMGRIYIEGLGAEALLDYLSTNNIVGKKNCTATYTLWCSESGTVIDDLIIYKESKIKYFVVVNAANREKDLVHLLHYSSGKDVIINERYNDDGILAVQGPKALALIAEIFPNTRGLKHMHFISILDRGQEIIVSRTGYTGENGVEIYAPNNQLVVLWNLILEKGRPFGIEAIGLGARDTLRLEMGYALYGHELSDEILPIESVSAWTIKWEKRDFLGKKALESTLQSNKFRHEYGIVLEDKGIAREGYPILQNEKQIGVVTSGTLSPTLQQSIAIVLVEKKLQEGDSVKVKIRDNLCTGRVVSLPFYSQSR
jgi:aminomethyltransferase